MNSTRRSAGRPPRISDTRAARSATGISRSARVTRQSSGSPSPAGCPRMWQDAGAMLRITWASSACAGTTSADDRGMLTSYPFNMRGARTMKMIKSTSTTSTSGVMLISECRWEPSLWTCMISVSLPLGAVVLCDKPYPMEAGVLDCEHDLPDHAEAEPGVAPDHDLDVRLLGARRGAEAVAEAFGGDRLIVDPQAAGVVDGDQDPASLVALLARLRRVRQM